MLEFPAASHHPIPLQPTLTPADRRRLRGKAQLIEPVLKVGRNGVTPPFVASVDEALKQHELIKIKFVEFKEEKKALVEQIAITTGSAIVQIVGHVAVFYRAKGHTAPAPASADETKA